MENHRDENTKRTKETEPDLIEDAEAKSSPEEEEEEDHTLPDSEFCEHMFQSSLALVFVLLSSGLFGFLFGLGLLDPLLPTNQTVSGHPRYRRVLTAFYTLTFLLGGVVAVAVRSERTSWLRRSAVLCGLLSVAHLLLTWHLVVFTEAGGVVLIVVSTVSSALIFYGAMVLWCYAAEVKLIREYEQMLLVS